MGIGRLFAEERHARYSSDLHIQHVVDRFAASAASRERLLASRGDRESYECGFGVAATYASDFSEALGFAFFNSLRMRPFVNSDPQSIRSRHDVAEMPQPLKHALPRRGSGITIFDNETHHYSARSGAGPRGDLVFIVESYVISSLIARLAGQFQEQSGPNQGFGNLNASVYLGILPREVAERLKAAVC